MFCESSCTGINAPEGHLTISSSTTFPPHLDERETCIFLDNPTDVFLLNRARYGTHYRVNHGVCLVGLESPFEYLSVFCCDISERSSFLSCHRVFPSATPHDEYADYWSKSIHLSSALNALGVHSIQVAAYKSETASKR